MTNNWFYLNEGDSCCWNKASSNYNSNGTWHKRKTCCSAGDPSCASLWQVLLVWMASVSSLSHPLCPLSGIQSNPILFLFVLDNQKPIVISKRTISYSSHLIIYIYIFDILNIWRISCNLIWCFALTCPECIWADIFLVDMGNKLLIVPVVFSSHDFVFAFVTP